MKKIMIVLFLLSMQFAIAQKVAYIEMERILDEMPAFTEASESIDTQIKVWEQELDNKFSSIESMYQEYVQNEAYLEPEMKQQKQDAIFQAENEANAYKEEKFGMDGELSQLQEEKFKPIYDQIYETAAVVAQENGYDYLFNKSDESNWIYTNQAHDLTEKVIEKLGLKE